MEVNLKTNKHQTILEVAVYYPIMDNGRYLGAVKVKNPDYLDTVQTITQYILDLNTFITNSVKKDEPLYFLPVGPELYKKIKEYTINQGKPPSSLSYVLEDNSESIVDRYKKAIDRANNNEVYVDLPYTLTQNDIENNIYRVLPGIGLKEIKKMGNDYSLPITNLKATLTTDQADYILNFIDKV